MMVKGKQTITTMILLLLCMCASSVSAATVTAGTAITPASYVNNMNVNYLVTGTSRVSVTFTTFLTEQEFDYVSIYDGNSASAAMLGQFSGTYPTPFTVVGSTGNLFLNWFTDDSNSHGDDAAEYTVTTGWLATTAASSSLAAGIYFSNVLVASTDATYVRPPTSSTSGQYLNNMNVQYLITAPTGTRALFEFDSFSSQPSNDTLKSKFV